MPDLDRFDADGFAIVEGVLTASEVSTLATAAERLLRESAAGDTVAVAARDVLTRTPEFRAAARYPAVRRLVAAVLGDTARCVKAILFDKPPGRSWGLFWHQDLTIAVRNAGRGDGFGRPSEKSGVPHVQPPAALLAKMLAIRLSLDDCGPDDGPLRVLPGTHRDGRLSDAEIADRAATVMPVECRTDAGAAVLMRPLLLHGSRRSTGGRRRRVLHLEFAADPLPPPLAWREEIV